MKNYVLLNGNTTLKENCQSALQSSKERKTSLAGFVCFENRSIDHAAALRTRSVLSLEKDGMIRVIHGTEIPVKRTTVWRGARYQGAHDAVATRSRTSPGQRLGNWRHSVH